MVVGHGDGAGGHRNLHHPLTHLGDLPGLHRHIGGGKGNGVVDELAYPGSGAHRLIVHLDAPGGQILEPALVDGGTGAALPPGGGHHGGGPIGRAVIAALWLGQEPQPLDQRLGLDMRLGLGSVLPFPVGLFPRGPVLGGAWRSALASTGRGSRLWAGVQ